MDLITAAAILSTQSMQLTNAVNSIFNQVEMIKSLANMTNSVPDINPQIKGILASMTVDVTALQSQQVIFQGIMDELARIVG